MAGGMLTGFDLRVCRDGIARRAASLDAALDVRAQGFRSQRARHRRAKMVGRWFPMQVSRACRRLGLTATAT